MKKNNKSGSICLNLRGIELCLNKEDIVEPEESISIKQLLNRAEKLSKMGVLNED